MLVGWLVGRLVELDPLAMSTYFPIFGRLFFFPFLYVCYGTNLECGGSDRLLFYIR